MLVENLQSREGDESCQIKVSFHCSIIYQCVSFACVNFKGADMCVISRIPEYTRTSSLQCCVQETEKGIFELAICAQVYMLYLQSHERNCRDGQQKLRIQF